MNEQSLIVYTMKRRDHPTHTRLQEQQSLYQKKRRAKYIEEHKDVSSALLDGLREERHDLPCDDDTTTAASRKKAQRDWWASQFMIPEWMVDVTSDLGSSWIVLPRPEGQRCIVTVSNGTVVVRNSSGGILEIFPSTSLAWASDNGSHKEYILDCIHQGGVFFVMDILCWGGLALLDCTAEFRMFWKASNVDFSTPDGRFCLVQHYEANVEGLRMAYARDALPCQKDGMVFLHKQCCYHGGQSPLMLRWKDHVTSRYCIETDAEGTPLPDQRIILSYSGGQSLVTGDDCPVPVAMLPSSLVDSCASFLLPGRLLIFKMTSKDGIHITENNVWLSLEYLGPANRRRRHADTVSKILFQHMARYCPLSFDALCHQPVHAPHPNDDHASCSIGCT